MILLPLPLLLKMIPLQLPLIITDPLPSVITTTIIIIKVLIKFMLDLRLVTHQLQVLYLSLLSMLEDLLSTTTNNLCIIPLLKRHMKLIWPFPKFNVVSVQCSRSNPKPTSPSQPLQKKEKKTSKKNQKNLQKKTKKKPPINLFVNNMYIEENLIFCYNTLIFVFFLLLILF